MFDIMRSLFHRERIERSSQHVSPNAGQPVAPAGALLALIASFLVVPGVQGEDWPQFRGPQRAGVAHEPKLLDHWPQDGLRVLWRQPLGEGFSGIAVVGDRLYTLAAGDGQEHALSLRVTDGSEVWRRPIGETFINQWGNGPRSTPTVDGDMLYAVSSKGQLLALDAKSGEVRWQVDYEADFGTAERSLPAPGGPVDEAPSPDWGHCSSPLVEGDLLIAFTRAGNGKSLVAFDKRTGEVRWSRFDHPHAHASPIAVTLGGQRQIVLTLAKEIVGLRPSGEVLWRHPWAVFSIATPVFVPPDKIFVSAPNEVGALLLQIHPTADGARVEETWRDPLMRNNWQSSLVHQESIVGFDNATLKALALDGGVRWAKRGLGKGTVVLADELLILLSDQGQLALARWNTESYQEIGRMKLLNGPTWTAPSPADGRLFLRNHEEIVCLDLEG